MPDPIFGGAFKNLFATGAVIGLGRGSYSLAETEYKRGLAWTVTGVDIPGKAVRLPPVCKGGAFQSDPANTATFVITVGNGTSEAIHPGEQYMVISDGSPDGITIALLGTSSGDSGGGGSGVSWQSIAENQTAAAGDGWDIDTTAGAVTLTLPASPAKFDEVHFRNSAQTFATNALTIGRNGQTIMGLAEDMTVDVNGADDFLWFNGTTWQLPGVQF